FVSPSLKLVGTKSKRGHRVPDKLLNDRTIRRSMFMLQSATAASAGSRQRSCRDEAESLRCSFLPAGLCLATFTLWCRLCYLFLASKTLLQSIHKIDYRLFLFSFGLRNLMT